MIDLYQFREGDVVWSLEDKVIGLSSVDLNGEWTSAGTRVEVLWQPWTVERVTPKGAWVQPGLRTHGIRGIKVWVSNNTRTVAPTKEQAKLNALGKRKYRVKMARTRLERAEERLRALERADVA